MSATGRLAAPPKPDGTAPIDACGRHALPSPRLADTLFYVTVPFLGGLFDAAAMAIIYQRGASGDVAVGWRLAVSVVAAGLAAHACCAFDSLKGSRPGGTDATSKPVRCAVFRKHSTAIKFSIHASAVALLACLTLLPWRAGAAFAAATAAGLCYAAPVLPGGRSPRSIPYFKGVLCAVVSTIVTTLVPAAVVGAPVARATALALHNVARSLAYETLQDLPDAAGDKCDGTRTLATAAGGCVSSAVVAVLATIASVAARAAGAPGLLVVPAAFFGWTGVHLADPKLFNRVAPRALPCLPLVVVVAVAVAGA